MKKVLRISRGWPWIILLAIFMCDNVQAQVNTDLVINSQTFSSGTWYRFFNTWDQITSPSISTSPVQISGTAFVQFLGGEGVILKPGFMVHNLLQGGLFKASTKVVEEVPSMESSYQFPPNDESNHPDIQKLSESTYRLVYTPYPDNEDDTKENPCILESTDEGRSFHPIAGVDLPLVDPPSVGHNCDPDYYHDNNSSEYIFYCEGNADNRVRLLTTTNNWGSYTNEIILSTSNTTVSHQIGSPAYINKNDLNYLFYVNVCPYYTSIQYITNSSIESGWEFLEPTTILGNPIFLDLNGLEHFYPWHINIIENSFNGQYYMLITGKTNPDGDKSENNDLYIAQSCDLINWDLYHNPIISKEDVGGLHQIYRSAGVFQDVNSLDIYWSYETYDGKHFSNETSSAFVQYPTSNSFWYIRLWKNISINGLFKCCSGTKNSFKEKIITHSNPSMDSLIINSHRINSEDVFKVYPNPNSGIINISRKTQDKSLWSAEITNMLGNKISHSDFIENNIIMNMETLAKGMYILKIQSGFNTIMQKIIVQ